MINKVMKEIYPYAVRWTIGKYQIVERWSQDGAKLYHRNEINVFGHQKKLYQINRLFSENEVYDKEEKDFVYQSQPSSLTDEFLKVTRFTISEAYEIIMKLIEKDRGKII